MTLSGSFIAREQMKPALAAGDYRLVLAPAIGGAIARFTWRGVPVFRDMTGGSVLDAACFPLVPFSNRIANGRFRANGLEVKLAPNFPGAHQPHPLHGFGWLAAWEIVEAGTDFARIVHRYDPGEWPWAYVAEQEFSLDAGGLTMTLRVRNLANSPMPAGLGFHPYFPRTPFTRYHGLHREQWITGQDGLPTGLEQNAAPRDWWRGQPVSARVIDTVYGGRHGPLTIVDPELGRVVTLDPTDNLSFTTIYVPANESFFCVEPVSHPTDPFNTEGSADKVAWLAPDATLEVRLRVSANER